MKLLQLCMLGSMAVFTTHTFAKQHTVSLGYAQTDIENNFDLKGMNAQYRYETTSPVSFLASVSYQTGDDQWHEAPDEQYSINAKHLTLLAGPAYRFNDVVSAYVVAGYALSEVESSYEYPGYSEQFDLSETNFAYGAGIIINPTEYLSVNLGYEATEVDSAKLSGFNIGLGYRF